MGRGIVRVPLGTATIDRGRIGLSQRRAALQPFDQIGIGDEVMAESEQVSLALRQAGLRQIKIVAVAGDVGVAEALPQRVEVERSRIARPARRTSTTWI